MYIQVDEVFCRPVEDSCCNCFVDEKVCRLIYDSYSATKLSDMLQSFQIYRVVNNPPTELSGMKLS